MSLEKERVVFTLKGITESIEGQGTIIVQPYSNNAYSNAPTGNSPIQILNQGRPISAGAHLSTKTATMVSVKMALYAGGLMGPLINAAISPLLNSVAEELTQNLTTTIEKLYSVDIPT